MNGILDLAPPPADKRIPYGPGPFQFGDLRLPRGPGPHPLVLAIHGGFWRARHDLTHLGHLCAAVTQLGYATFSVEYRRVGNPGGGFPGTLADVGLAADSLPAVAKEHALRLDRVIALGHSAGGQLALWLAGRHHVPAGSPLRQEHPFRLGGVVCLAGVTDLAQAQRLKLGKGIITEFMGGSPEEVPSHYSAASPLQLLPLGVPQRLIHGSEDDTVPLALSQDYAKKAHGWGDAATLRVLPGMGHFEPVDPRSGAWLAVRDALFDIRMP